MTVTGVLTRMTVDNLICSGSLLFQDAENVVVVR